MNRGRTVTVAIFLCTLLLFGILVPSGSRRPAVSAQAVDYRFNGTGRAHGVGMCMDGVYYMAQAGVDYRSILNYYYTGIDFSMTDEAQPIRVRGRDGQIRTWTMHDYLYHLQEEPDHYPYEELKALYVAARTYTLSVMARGKHTAEGFDICSSGDCCQACNENRNINNYPNSKRACDETYGEIMTYNGQPIIAAYCGSCGGHTENNEDVWGGAAIPYLRGRTDDYCWQSPRYSWSGAFTRAELEARLNSSSDTSVGTLYSINLSDKTPGGRVRRAVITGSEGKKTVSGAVLQALLGFSSTRFDFAIPNFDEYLLVYNPNDEDTDLVFTFMLPDGSSYDHSTTAAAHSRYTLKVNDHAVTSEVSVKLVSDLPVLAERSEYFNMHGKIDGGHESMGVPSPGQAWYVAEGYTGGSFESFILIQNPGASDQQVKMTFMLPGGATLQKTITARASSRVTVKLDDIPGLENTEVSAMLEAEGGDGIIVERCSYFSYNGLFGGSNAPAVEAPSDEWHFAEGYTGEGFDSYFLVQNPSDSPAEVTASFMKEDGQEITKGYTLPATSRFTIKANEVPGLGQTSFAVSIRSVNGVEIIAERAQYFNYGGFPCAGGTDSVGATGTATRWYLAEGYDSQYFDTWILVSNPGDSDASVRMTFNTPDGRDVVHDTVVGAGSRYTLNAGKVAGLENREFSATVEATNGKGIVVERAMYFIYTGGGDKRAGGHSTIGAPSLSTEWYFAEGYTGY